MTHPDDLTLGDYVDGALDANRERSSQVDTHLRECAACRAVVEELRVVRAAVAALPVMPPPARAWTRIEHAISDEASARHRASHAPRWSWLAAAAALVIATAIGVMWWKPAGERQAAVAPAADTAQDTALQIQAELMQAEQHYQKAITLLEGIAKASEGALDQRTVAALDMNLALVDKAIAESRAALRADPANASAQRSLLDGYKSKLAVLEDAVALIDRLRSRSGSG